MKIFISHPIFGYDLETRRARTAELAEKIKSLGHEPVNPFDVPMPPDGLTEKEAGAYSMGEHMKQLLVCDAILNIIGGHLDTYCHILGQAAHLAGLKMYFNIDNIPNSNQEKSKSYEDLHQHTNNQF